jgi:hypothetical protein
VSASAIASTVISALTGNTLAKVLTGLAGGLLIAILFALGVRYIYNKGFDAADRVRRAEVAELERAHALALAKAEAEVRRRLEAAAAKTAKVEGQYLSAVKTIAAQRRTITRERIANASRTAVSGDCLFGPEWVCLYNQAIGAGAGDGGGPVPGTASGADNATGAAPPADAGVLRAVTPEDILAHIRDYGARNRQLEEQVRGWIEWAGGVTP